MFFYHYQVVNEGYPDNTPLQVCTSLNCTENSHRNQGPQTHLHNECQYVALLHQITNTQCPPITTVMLSYYGNINKNVQELCKLIPSIFDRSFS